jgi:hypothetical protein
LLWGLIGGRELLRCTKSCFAARRDVGIREFRAFLVQAPNSTGIVVPGEIAWQSLFSE